MKIIIWRRKFEIVWKRNVGAVYVLTVLGRPMTFVFVSPVVCGPAYFMRSTALLVLKEASLQTLQTSFS